MSVPFTQYMRPDGRTREITIDLDSEHEKRAQAIIEQGYRFEAEVLTTGQVSLTVHDPGIGGGEPLDIAINIVPNAEAVPVAVAQLIDETQKLLGDWPCECGHAGSWHKHADRCRFEDCRCPLYREAFDPKVKP